VKSERLYTRNEYLDGPCAAEFVTRTSPRKTQFPVIEVGPSGVPKPRRTAMTNATGAANVQAYRSALPPISRIAKKIENEMLPSRTGDFHLYLGDVGYGLINAIAGKSKFN
jgi:hypothetical protein